MTNSALITGGAKRVGHTLALGLAKQGYDIALHYHQSEDEALAVKQEIEALGRRAEVFAFDLSNVEQIDSWFAEIYQAFPNLNLLINNASIFERVSFTDSTPDTYARHTNINTAAPIFLTQAFAKHVANGQVINLLDSNITSIHGSHFFYLLSKKTLAEFTKMAARDLGPAIRVNAICPGVVLPSDQDVPGYNERLKEKLPLDGLSELEDITGAIDYFLRAPHITGQLLFVDSGQHLL